MVHVILIVVTYIAVASIFLVVGIRLGCWAMKVQFGKQLDEIQARSDAVNFLQDGTLPKFMAESGLFEEN